jgi:hypothetical protein
MKIEYVTGCTCDSLTVDGKETVDMDVNDLKLSIHKMIDSIDSISTLQDIVMNVTELEGDYECLGHCDQCGDTIYKHTLEI